MASVPGKLCEFSGYQRRQSRQHPPSAGCGVFLAFVLRGFLLLGFSIFAARWQLFLRFVILPSQVLLHTLVNLEAIDARAVYLRHAWRDKLLICEEEQMSECSAKISTIKTFQFGRLWNVDFSAVGAVHLGRALPQLVREADGKHCLMDGFALCQRASSIHIAVVLVQHGCHSAARQDEAGVDKAVQHLGSGFHQRCLIIL
mmetsp:Transcript_53285/g.127477  ORF Transcript_53285/g.127477 Transcript_53285/m.127477 type:complete len:201 (+) Transcript_53285:128-730(+)